MQPMPLVGAEVQRVATAFRAAADELTAATTAVGGLDRPGIGTASCDAAVAGGLADLQTALARLEDTAQSCLRALGRHAGAGAAGAVPGAAGDVPEPA